MAEMTLAEVAALVGGAVEPREVAGAVVSGVESLDRARGKHVTFYVEGPRKPLFIACRAACVMVRAGVAKPEKTGALIVCDDPDAAFTKLCEHWLPRPTRPKPGIHPTAVIGAGAEIAADASIGPYTVIGERVKVGARSIIHSHCSIMEGAVIGDDCVIYPGCVVREFVIMGRAVMLQPGAVIGGDGFGYKLRDGELKLVPQLGTVDLADDVHIGANSTIDRARFGKTVLGKGTKVDNLCQIAHNVRIGTGCGIAALSGIAGSAIIEDFCDFSGGTGVANDVTVGAGTKLRARAAVDRDLPPGSTMYWSPARPGKEVYRLLSIFEKLPELMKTVKRLEAAVALLESSRLGDGKGGASG
jgi:UDP-3-O-[3-hydroxymyristoyl] glucosamine N-acyltransferase